MSQALRTEYYATAEDYLTGERTSGQKHEYLAGVIRAVAGATVGHDRIAGNIFSELRQQLRGRPCEVFSSDVKVRIRRDAAEFYYYPDVTVDCSQAGPTDLYAGAPRVIFEVLSPDTERVDRVEKLRNCQSLPTLDTYVLVDQFQAAVTFYRRTADGWSMEFLAEKTGGIVLPPIGCSLPLAAVYERTTLV